MWHNRMFIFSFVLCFVNSVRSDVICEHGFCENYVVAVGCPDTSLNCRAPNSTHQGLSVLSPTVCNCCEYCMPLHFENERCSPGGAGNGLSVGRCGDGLSCLEDRNGGFCRRIPGDISECHRRQDVYDDKVQTGQVGALEERPLCDAKGKHGPVACVSTQTCFCQNEDGRRIFGEMLYQGEASIKDMHCGCSRFHETIKSVLVGLRQPVIGPRCTSDGNYNPVQCVGSTCYCVDRITGEIQNGDSIHLGREPITSLWCYDPSLDLFPYLSDEHSGPPYSYTTPCYEDMREKVELMQQSEDEGFITDFLSEIQDCLPDGTYGRIYLNVNRTKMCVDDHSHQIGSYESTPNTPGYAEMNCKCALTSIVMEGSLEKPVCCSNGNYRPIQCRRGVCRCVESDGRQVGVESADVTQLQCYSDGWQNC